MPSLITTLSTLRVMRCFGEIEDGRDAGVGAGEMIRPGVARARGERGVERRRHLGPAGAVMLDRAPIGTLNPQVQPVEQLGEELRLDRADRDMLAVRACVTAIEGRAAVEQVGRAPVVPLPHCAERVEQAQRLAGFGARLIGFDPYVTPARAEQIGVELATLDEVMEQSDFITIHIPKTPETTGMIGDAQFKIAKPNLRIVNCSRGGIIDEEALFKALSTNQIAGAGLDVFVNEHIFAYVVQALAERYLKPLQKTR